MTDHKEFLELTTAEIQFLAAAVSFTMIAILGEDEKDHRKLVAMLHASRHGLGTLFQEAKRKKEATGAPMRCGILDKVLALHGRICDHTDHEPMTRDGLPWQQPIWPDFFEESDNDD